MVTELTAICILRAGVAQWRGHLPPTNACVPGSIPRFSVIRGLSLLVVFSAQRGFSLGAPVFPSPQKPIFDFN